MWGDAPGYSRGSRCGERVPGKQCPVGIFLARKSSCACARLTRAKTRATRDCVVLQRSRHGEAAAGGSTGGDVPAPGMAYVPRHLVQKVKGVAGLLTEARVRAVRSCRGVGIEVLRRRTGGARGGGCCRGNPGLLIHRGGPCGPCEGAEGVNAAGAAPAASNCGGTACSPAVDRARFR